MGRGRGFGAANARRRYFLGTNLVTSKTLRPLLILGIRAGATKMVTEILEIGYAMMLLYIPSIFN